MELGKRLAKLREEKGCTLKEVAAYLNRSISAISNYERGIRTPDPDTLAKLADFYKVSLDYLMHRTTYKAPIETLNRKIYLDYTLGDMMNDTLELDRPRIRPVLKYYEGLWESGVLKRKK